MADDFFPNFTVETPEISVTGRLLKNQRNSMGESPAVRRHWTLADSPKLAGSPKSKAAMRNGTAISIVDKMTSRNE